MSASDTSSLPSAVFFLVYQHCLLVSRLLTALIDESLELAGIRTRVALLSAVPGAVLVIGDLRLRAAVASRYAAATPALL